ncbi:hypothetical protein SPH9361_02877 [Sphingobium sp. CECT 9361]|nr:aminoglycoside phosphotransferase [Sphingobium sp. CECT 9361]CAH0354022.1 hypothetical protein SPH9361_02877 [Sphingobium sp. CECT 9361]
MPMADPSDLTEWLASGEAFRVSGPVRRIDTHAASIFLNGETAWKIKRPVDLGYLDFSTPDKRRMALEAELKLNRRTAPALYKAVHPITRDEDGSFAIDGDGEAADWILEMRRFPDGALWSELADRNALDEVALQKLADALVGFHAKAQIAWPGDGAARIGKIIAGNAEAMALYPDILEPKAVAELTGRLEAHVDQNSGLLDARGKAGRIRHVHGDLHLANIATIDGVPTPFDCLEFDPELATTDVLYDLAFLLMDLPCCKGRPGKAIQRHVSRATGFGGIAGRRQGRLGEDPGQALAQDIAAQDASSWRPADGIPERSRQCRFART